jgi:hypothetical protein
MRSMLVEVMSCYVYDALCSLMEMLETEKRDAKIIFRIMVVLGTLVSTHHL